MTSRFNLISSLFLLVGGFGCSGEGFEKETVESTSSAVIDDSDENKVAVSPVPTDNSFVDSPTLKPPSAIVWLVDCLNRARVAAGMPKLGQASANGNVDTVGRTESDQACLAKASFDTDQEGEEPLEDDSKESINSTTDDNVRSDDSVPESSKVALLVMVYPLEDAARLLSSGLLFKEYAKKIRAQYPYRSIRSITITSEESASEELKHKLSQTLREGERLSNLLIASHGEVQNGDAKLTLDEQAPPVEFEVTRATLGPISSPIEWTTISRLGSPIVNTFADEFDDELNKEIISVFGGIRSKFTKDSSVVLATCGIATGDPEVVSRRLRAFARILGLSSGQIYAAEGIHYSLTPSAVTTAGSLIHGISPLYVAGVYAYLAGTVMKKPAARPADIAYSLALVAGAHASQYFYVKRGQLGRKETYPLNKGYTCKLFNGEVKSCIRTQFQQAEAEFLFGPSGKPSRSARETQSINDLERTLMAAP